MVVFFVVNKIIFSDAQPQEWKGEKEGVQTVLLYTVKYYAILAPWGYKHEASRRFLWF